MAWPVDKPGSSWSSNLDGPTRVLDLSGIAFLIFIGAYYKTAPNSGSVKNLIYLLDDCFRSERFLKEGGALIEVILREDIIGITGYIEYGRFRMQLSELFLQLPTIHLLTTSVINR
jgi:hypothetical protein